MVTTYMAGKNVPQQVIDLKPKPTHVALTASFPKNRCERADSGISPRTKKFFLQKRLSQKSYPLYVTEPFLDRFLSEGA